MTFQPKLITFDADDTLWDFGKMMERGTQAVAAAIHSRFNGQYTHLTSDYLAAAQHRYVESQDQQTVHYEEARRVVFREAFAQHPEGQTIGDELLEIYLTARNLRYELYEDTHSTLAALKGKYHLGWLSNGTADAHQLGLAEYFDVIITGSTLNLRKPKAEFFLHAAQVCGCEIGDMLHVGDSLVSDVGGALWAGAKAVWYNPNLSTNNTRIKPSAEIRQLSELLGLLV